MPDQLRQHFVRLKPAWAKPVAGIRKIHVTSWLDGLRGLAAFLVYIHHSVNEWAPWIRSGFGSTKPEYEEFDKRKQAPFFNDSFFQLPIIRIVFSGGAMVSIFFVISGYVLSTKALRLSRQRRQTEVFETLVSSTFRRGLRLYLPCTVSTFLTANLSMYGLLSRRYWRQDTLWQQYWDWIQHTLELYSPFSGGSSFEANLWTIPREFKGSLYIFITILGLVKCRATVRSVFLVGFLIYWIWCSAWDFVLFTAGMVLADFHHIRYRLAHDGSLLLPSSSPGRIHNVAESKDTEPEVPRRTNMAYILLTLLAVFLLSVPEYSEGATSSTGYSFLSGTLTPPSYRDHWGPGRFWACMGAILLVLTLDLAGPTSILQQLFTTRFIQYLGEISFSLYLAHGAMIDGLGNPIYDYFFSVFKVFDGNDWNTVALFCTWIVLTPLVFWVSDILTAVVDQGTINFTRAMMNWATADDRVLVVG